MLKQVLIVTVSNESNAGRVIEHLTTMGTGVFRLDTDRLLKNAVFTCEAVAGRARWCMRVGSETITSEEIASIWYRRPADPKARPDVAEHCREFVETEGKKFLRNLWSVTDERTIFWLNHPRVLRTMESNKLYQLHLAAKVGLRVPETIVTNNPSVANDFFRRWSGDIILKTFGGVQIRTEKGEERVVYTNRVSRESLEQFSEEIRQGPVMLQNYVPKAFELRITAVGDTLFTCAIYSQDSPRTKDDWRRYDFEQVRHAVFTLPTDIEAKLKKFMRDSGLKFGAIDMVVTPDGEYVFLEVNPSGQWHWIEVLTNMPITRTIAELLANPPQEKER